MSQTAIRARNAGRRGGATAVRSIKKLLFFVVLLTALFCSLMFGLLLFAASHMQ